MKTYADLGTSVGKSVSVRSSRQACTVKDVLMRRLLGLLDATMRETWLPMGLRALVVQEVPLMRRELERTRSTLVSFESRLNGLIEAADAYRCFASRSRLFLSLRLLDSAVKTTKLSA